MLLVRVIGVFFFLSHLFLVKCSGYQNVNWHFVIVEVMDVTYFVLSTLLSFYDISQFHTLLGKEI